MASKPEPRCRYFPYRHLLVAVDRLAETADPAATAKELVDRALLQLSAQARADCRAAVVGWVRPDGATVAAAIDLSPSGEDTLVAASWQPRHLWVRPSPDPDESPESALQNAIALVKAEVDPGPRAANLDAIEGALELCAQCFRLAGGVPPAGKQSFPAESEQWRDWLTDFAQAAEAEWLRLFPKAALRAVEPATTSGTLSGLRVFVSYAMPTNVDFARPVVRALQSEGASLWFDQAARPTTLELARGLREAIAEQDVFLLCASHELFDNAGYALQELAWALNLQAEGSWLGGICVAEFEDVMLPRTLDKVPRVQLSQIEAVSWPAAIVDLVLRTRATRNSIQQSILLPPKSWPPPPPCTLRELTREESRVRAQHVEAWWKLGEDSLLQALAAAPGEGTRLPEYDRLRQAIHDLGWDGTLATYDTWPADPAVRDTRIRLGALNTLFVIPTIEPSSARSRDKLKADIEFLTERRLPLLDEQVVEGWDDEERRLAVRYYLGMLTQVAQLLRRGLAAALFINWKAAERQRWECLLRERRLDCADCLLQLRKQGRVRWEGGPPVLWDAAYHAFDAFLHRGVDQWMASPPDWVQLAVTGTRSDLSTMFADTMWRASRTNSTVTRQLDVPALCGSVRFQVTVAPQGHAVPVVSRRGTRAIALLATLEDDRADIALDWSDEEATPPDGSVKATRVLKL